MPAREISGGVLIRTLLVCTLVLGLVPVARAVPIHVEVQADVSALSPHFPNYIALGTTMNVSLDFEVGPGTPGTAARSGGTGTATWTDGTGLRTFNIISILPGGATSALGLLTLFFDGLGPTILGDTADGLNVTFDLGVNPFTTTEELSDLILASSVTQLFLRIDRPGVVNAPTTLQSNVSSTIVRVAEPGLLSLFGIGLCGLVLLRKTASG